MTGQPGGVIVRNTRAEDFGAIIELGRLVYPQSPCWSEQQLVSHLNVFPEGQFVAEDTEKHQIVGMAASLIIRWADYDLGDDWRDFTQRGMLTNHDPEGRTLYGAEVMVRPDRQGRGIGTLIYDAREELVRGLGLLRIRAGARLRGYGRYADRMRPEEYLRKVVREKLRDPTLTFQLHRGFRVLALVRGYLKNDRESLGYAAVIEWIDPEAARRENYTPPRPPFDPNHRT